MVERGSHVTVSHVALTTSPHNSVADAGTMPPARSILPYKKPSYSVQLAPHEIVVRSQRM